jgi:hypothetical protein
MYIRINVGLPLAGKYVHLYNCRAHTGLCLIVGLTLEICTFVSMYGSHWLGKMYICIIVGLAMARKYVHLYKCTLCTCPGNIYICINVQFALAGKYVLCINVGLAMERKYVHLYNWRGSHWSGNNIAVQGFFPEEFFLVDKWFYNDILLSNVIITKIT